jgi:hypothetical protein
MSDYITETQKPQEYEKMAIKMRYKYQSRTTSLI